MSVDYNCGIAFGWKISSQEHLEMNSVVDYEYEDDFICVNAFRSSDYIFGCWLYQCSGDGEIKEINIYDLADKLPDDFYTEALVKLQHMRRPDLADAKPSIYLVGQVC